MTIEDQIAEGDRVTTRWSAVAATPATFAGIAPTGREVCSPAPTSTASTAVAFAEVWEQIDFASLIAQLI